MNLYIEVGIVFNIMSTEWDYLKRQEKRLKKMLELKNSLNNKTSYEIYKDTHRQIADIWDEDKKDCKKTFTKS